MGNNTVLVENKNGEMVDAEILLYFTLKDYEDKKYVLYTFNETDDNDLATIYASEVVLNNDGIFFIPDVIRKETNKELKNVLYITFIKEN